MVTKEEYDKAQAFLKKEQKAEEVKRQAEQIKSAYELEESERQQTENYQKKIQGKKELYDRYSKTIAPIYIKCKCGKAILCENPELIYFENARNPQMAYFSSECQDCKAINFSVLNWAGFVKTDCPVLFLKELSKLNKV